MCENFIQQPTVEPGVRFKSSDQLLTLIDSGGVGSASEPTTAITVSGSPQPRHRPAHPAAASLIGLVLGNAYSRRQAAGSGSSGSRVRRCSRAKPSTTHGFAAEDSTRPAMIPCRSGVRGLDLSRVIGRAFGAPGGHESDEPKRTTRGDASASSPWASWPPRCRVRMRRRKLPSSTAPGTCDGVKIARVDVRRGRPVDKALIVVPVHATMRVAEVPFGAACVRRQACHWVTLFGALVGCYVELERDQRLTSASVACRSISATHPGQLEAVECGDVVVELRDAARADHEGVIRGSRSAHARASWARLWPR